MVVRKARWGPRHSTPLCSLGCATPLGTSGEEHKGGTLAAKYDMSSILELSGGKREQSLPRCPQTRSGTYGTP